MLKKSKTHKSPLRKSRRRKSPLRKRSQQKSRTRKSRTRKSRTRKSPLRKRSQQKSRTRKSRTRKSPLRKRSQQKCKKSQFRSRKSGYCLKRKCGSGRTRDIVTRICRKKKSPGRKRSLKKSRRRKSLLRNNYSPRPKRQISDIEDDPEPMTVADPEPMTVADDDFISVSHTDDIQESSWKSDIYTTYQEYKQAVSIAESEFIKIQTKHKNDSHAVTREMFQFIIKEFLDENNPLIPSKLAQYILKYFIDNHTKDFIIDPSKCTNSEWLELMGGGDILWGAFSARNECDAREDQKIRANAIADSLIETNSKNLVLLDGHGRIFYEILSSLKVKDTQNFNDYTFDIYEIDPNAHAWHLYFFPKSVTSYGQNIFHAVKKFTITPTIHQFTGLGVLYLNFCAFGEFLELSEKAIEYLTKRKIHVFVGFSVRNIKSIVRLTNRNIFFSRSMKNKLRYADAVLISKRKDYCTFKYSEKTYNQEPKRSRRSEEQEPSEEDGRKEPKRSRRSEEQEPSDFNKALNELDYLRRKRKKE